MEGGRCAHGHRHSPVTCLLSPHMKIRGFASLHMLTSRSKAAGLCGGQWEHSPDQVRDGKLWDLVSLLRVSWSVKALENEHLDSVLTSHFRYSISGFSYWLIFAWQRVKVRGCWRGGTYNIRYWRVTWHHVTHACGRKLQVCGQVGAGRRALVLVISCNLRHINLCLTRIL